MLYVFHVDAGQMTTYDMSLTLQSVSSLKAAIEKKTKIPASSLVLLVSGGEVLQSDHMVSSYSAGTDTNPIFLFSKPAVKDSYIHQSMCDLSPIVELSSGEFRSDSRSAFDGKSLAELKSAVEKCCSLPRTLDTITSCANLAIQFSNLAHDVSRSCEQLVHEQHLQHQGWAAVVANLEDIYSEFCERSKSFKEAFKKYRLKKEEYHDLLNRLNDVLEALGKIPMLPALQINAEAYRFSAFDVFEDTDFEGHHYGVNPPLGSSSEARAADFGTGVFKLSEEDVFELKNMSNSNEGANSESGHLMEELDDGVMFKAPSVDSKEEPTLLHWILAQGNKASLQDILDYCQKGLALIDAEPLKEREAELYNIISYANMHGLKQIKGIEDRLYGLDQLLNGVKKIERDQRDQAAALFQVRDRFNTHNDHSVLPTFVESNWRQLEMLLKGHQDLVDIRRRIAKSKDELSHILKARLEAVLTIENSMSVQDAHAMLSYQCFNRLARYFGIVAQLHRAPAVFVRAVHEVARRRTFSAAHLRWAVELAEKLRVIHDEEVDRRQEFNSHFEDHFLRTLFPGMTDLPPPFATQAPPAFDERLPKLTSEDVEFVADAFPDLEADVPKYDMDLVIKFFQQRLTTSEHEERDVDVQVDFDKDFESETDTEFEKLSRQSGPKQTTDTSTTCVPDTMAVSTVTEENMDTQKLNIEKLQEFLAKLFSLCKINIMFIKDELVKLKKDVDEQTKFVYNIYETITRAWERNQQETEVRFREHTQRLTVDHELELSDMKAVLNDKEFLISNMKKEIDDLKGEHKNEIMNVESDHERTKDVLEKTREQIKQLENKLSEFEADKQKELKEMQEKLHLEYKAEIESLRSRFRLVALTNNMDRSPSESSLEKIERTDVIEISNHNAIIMQTKENAEEEKERAIKETIDKCREEFEQKLNTEISALKAKYETDKQVSANEVSRRLLSEKDRQLELLREREQQLLRECGKYRDTLRQLTDPETNDYDALLKAQFTTLENEKAQLQQQVTELKKELDKKNDESEKSREDENSDGRSSPRRRARSHTPLGLASGSLSLSACLPGHTVLLLWDPQHLNYTVLQESSMMYFVHGDSLPALDLSINVKNESERRLYAIGVVESKEYCYAKKNGNRFHMLRGSRFYRVRVKPLKPHLPYPSCCDPRHKQDAASEDTTRALLPVFSNRPLRKWLTYVHAKDTQKSLDTSQSTSSNTDEASRVEVATGTLINLESPVSSGDAPAPPDELDSIQLESSAHWHASRMQGSTSSIMTDMECSVGRCPAPELAPPAELAEEAAP